MSKDFGANKFPLADRTKGSPSVLSEGNILSYTEQNKSAKEMLAQEATPNRHKF